MADNIWFPTFTGLRVDPENLSPDMFCIMDIAHGTAKQCRFAGHLFIDNHYSSAEHAVRVSQIAGVIMNNDTDVMRKGLMHDAAESYMLDMPRPFKMLLPEYTAMEMKIATAINDKYGIDDNPKSAVSRMIHRIDMVMPVVEAQYAHILPHPENLPPMNGRKLFKSEKEFTEFIEFCYSVSNKFQPNWGWIPSRARNEFIRMARYLGINDDSMTKVMGDWETTCGKCQTKVTGSGSFGKCPNPKCGHRFEVVITL